MSTSAKNKKKTRGDCAPQPIRRTDRSIDYLAGAIDRRPASQSAWLGIAAVIVMIIENVTASGSSRAFPVLAKSSVATLDSTFEKLTEASFRQADGSMSLVDRRFLWIKRFDRPGRNPYPDGLCIIGITDDASSLKYKVKSLVLCPQDKGMAIFTKAAAPTLVYVLPTGQMAKVDLATEAITKSGSYNSTGTVVDLRSLQFMLSCPGTSYALTLLGTNRWAIFDVDNSGGVPILKTTDYLVRESDGDPYIGQLTVVDAKIEASGAKQYLVMTYRLDGGNLKALLAEVGGTVTPLMIFDDSVYDMTSFFVKSGYLWCFLSWNGVGTAPANRFYLATVAVPSSPAGSVLTANDFSKQPVSSSLSLHGASFFPFAIGLMAKPSPVYWTFGLNDAGNFGRQSQAFDYQARIQEHATGDASLLAVPPIDPTGIFSLFESSGDWSFGFTYQKNTKEEPGTLISLQLRDDGQYLHAALTAAEDSVPSGYRSDKYFYLEACTVADCAQCDGNKDVCMSCKDGGVLIGNACRPPTCPSGCECLSNVCSSCATGYADLANDCKTCDTGYVLHEGQCKLCAVDRCQTCSTDALGSCSLCFSNYTGPRCDACADGYHWREDHKRCLLTCPGSDQFVGCLFCENPATPVCASCKQGYFGLPGGCAECDVGYYKTSESSGCMPSCPQNCQGGCDIWGVCKSCKHPWTGPQCDSCKQHWYYEAGVCKPYCKIGECTGGCYDYNKCSQCQVGYNTTAAADCSVCETGFDIDQDCKACIDGKFEMVDGSCLPICSSDCQPGFCEGPDKCTNCKPGFSGETCSPLCSPNCLAECSSEYYCGGICRPGWYGDGCLECHPDHQSPELGCPLRCDVVADRCPTGCTKEANVCDQCSGNFAGSRCDQCTDGYHLNKQGTDCIADCGIERCQNDYCAYPGVCAACETGYGGDTCDQCAPLYLRNREGICIFCSIDFCSQCATPNSCAACSEHHLAADGSACLPLQEVCRPTIQHCEVCLDSARCSLCRAPYYLNDDGSKCLTLSDLCPIQFCTKCDRQATCLTCTDGRVPTQDGSACIYSCNIANCDSCDANGKCLHCTADFVMSLDSKRCEAFENVRPELSTSVFDLQSQEVTVDLTISASSFDLDSLIFEIRDEIAEEIHPCEQCYAQLIPGFERSLKFYIISDLQILRASLLVTYDPASLRVQGSSRLLQTAPTSERLTVPDIRLAGKRRAVDTTAHDAFTAVNAIRFFSTIILSVFDSPHAFWSTYQFSWLQLWSLLRGPYLAYPDRLLQWHMKWYLLVINWGEPFDSRWDDWSKGSPCRADREYPMNKQGCSFTDNFGQNFVVVFLVFIFCLLMTAIFEIKKRLQVRSDKNLSDEVSWTDRILENLGYLYFLKWMSSIQPSVIYFSILQLYTYFYTPHMAFGAFLAIFFIVYYLVTAVLSCLLARTLWAHLGHLPSSEQVPNLGRLAKAVGGPFFSVFAFQFNDMKRVTAFWQLLFPLVDLVHTALVSLFMVALGEGPLPSLGCLLAVELAWLFYQMRLACHRSHVVYGLLHPTSSLLFVLFLILKISTAEQSAHPATSELKTGMAMMVFVSILWAFCLIDISADLFFSIWPYIRKAFPKKDAQTDLQEKKIDKDNVLKKKRTARERSRDAALRKQRSENLSPNPPPAPTPNS